MVHEIGPVASPRSLCGGRGSPAFANIGQAKHMVSSALQALHSVLPAVAAQVEADLTQGSAPIVDLSVPEPKPPGWLDRQKAPLQIGQLKALAAPFYTRLHAVAPAWLASQRQTNGTELGGIFPWTDDPSDDEPHALANLGQLKAVFALRLETLPPADPGDEMDSDGDGIPDHIEIAIGSDPFKAHTSGTVIPDGWIFQHLAHIPGIFHATLTDPGTPNAGRVFFTNVEIKTGWQIVGIPY